MTPGRVERVSGIDDEIATCYVVVVNGAWVAHMTVDMR